MKRFFATTAAALILSTGAYAESHSAKPMENHAMRGAIIEYQYDSSMSLLASNLIGMNVYASEAKPGNTINDGDEQEWDDIGEINDIAISRQGEIEAVIVGVGGFLGMGEKDVALDMRQIKVVRDNDDMDDYFLVVTASRETIENAPGFDRGDDMGMKPMNRDHAMEDGAMHNNGMTDRSMNENWTPFARPEIEEEGYNVADMADMTAENLTGANVYSINGEDIGEVSEITLNEDGSAKMVMLDIGGFLGMGETHVPVSFDELNIQRSDDGDEFRVYIDATQEGLESRTSANR